MFEPLFQLPAFQLLAELFSGDTSGSMDANSKPQVLPPPKYANVQINPPVLQELATGSKTHSRSPSAPLKGPRPSAVQATELEVHEYNLRKRGKLRLKLEYDTQVMNEMVSTNNTRTRPYHSAYSSGKTSWRSNSVSIPSTSSGLSGMSYDTYHSYTSDHHGPTHNSSETLEDLILAKNGTEYGNCTVC